LLAGAAAKLRNRCMRACRRVVCCNRPSLASILAMMTMC
jgi:hypothetical protein